MQNNLIKIENSLNEIKISNDLNFIDIDSEIISKSAFCFLSPSSIMYQFINPPPYKGAVKEILESISEINLKSLSCLKQSNISIQRIRLNSEYAIWLEFLIDRLNLDRISTKLSDLVLIVSSEKIIIIE